MLHDLVSPTEYDNLPDDPNRAFVEIERICRREMEKTIRANDADAYNVQLQYMMTVSSAASELNVPNVAFPDLESGNFEHVFSQFQLEVGGALTRLKIREAKGNKPHSVRLSNRTRALIVRRVQSLREAIELGEMPEKKRKALLSRLDALSAEINSESRVSFAKVMTALAFIAAGTSGIADAPQAIANITELLGIDKEAEEQEQLRLNAPMQAITYQPDETLDPKQSKRPSANAPAFDPNDDSDIPF